MSATDDGSGGQSWFVRLSRFLRAGAEDRAETPADLPSSRVVPTPPEIVLLDAVVSGMPDPVTVLDQEGRVIAFNAQASVLAPALRRGEPASIALRMPELVEARLNLGISLYQQQKSEEARANFTEVLQRNPTNTMAIKYMQKLQQENHE